MTRAKTPNHGDLRIADHRFAITRRVLRIALAGGAALTLAACEPGAGPFGSSTASGEATAKPQTSTRLVDRDIEAPQVFQTSDTALWDGRPSLGGVWVASPNAKDPERVIMRNPANGKFVIGALFRRERDNPGPVLQISSDAAEALGVLAGQPVKISVTALRREQAANPAPAPSAPILDSQERIASPAPGAIDAGGVTTLALPPANTAVAAAGTAAAAASTKPAAAPAVKPAAKPAAKPATTSGRSIQVGFFSQEANATRARDTLAKSGVSAQIRKESAQGKDYWSVFTKGDAASLKKIKAAGFADAYMLK